MDKKISSFLRFVQIPVSKIRMQVIEEHPVSKVRVGWLGVTNWIEMSDLDSDDKIRFQSNDDYEKTMILIKLDHFWLKCV